MSDDDHDILSRGVVEDLNTTSSTATPDSCNRGLRGISERKHFAITVPVKRHVPTEAEEWTLWQLIPGSSGGDQSVRRVDFGRSK